MRSIKVRYIVWVPLLALLSFIAVTYAAIVGFDSHDSTQWYGPNKSGYEDWNAEYNLDADFSSLKCPWKEVPASTPTTVPSYSPSWGWAGWYAS
jgi:hypothetical protein